MIEANANQRPSLVNLTGWSFVLNVSLIMAGVATMALGLLALLGWVLGLPIFASFRADLIPMVPSTAALFLVYGVTDQGPSLPTH